MCWLLLKDLSFDFYFLYLYVRCFLIKIILIRVDNACFVYSKNQVRKTKAGTNTKTDFYFYKCREEISSALNDFGNRWCKREGVEDNALKEWKRSIFTIVDKRIKFYSQNTNILPPKPKSSFRHLKQGIQEFHRKYVLVPADKAANNVVVVCRLHYVNTLKQELDGTRAYLETDTDEVSTGAFTY